LAFSERHLGLLTASQATLPSGVLDAWGQLGSEWLNLAAIVDIAREARDVGPIEGAGPTPSPTERCRIGIAWDDAFHFYYDDNLSRLEALGATLVRFAPTRDGALPDVDGLYLGGGYPEIFARELSENAKMRESIARFARSGGPVYAECGGLMYLSRAIRTRDDRLHPMVGLVPVETIMKDRLVALGYVEVTTHRPTILGPPGLSFRGHQFRYSELGPLDAPIESPYTVRRPRGAEATAEGFVVGNLVASYIHAHWASNPRVAEAFVTACVAHNSRRRTLP
jgi:cobyrinic acid a,c-diamide synthase